MAVYSRRFALEDLRALGDGAPWGAWLLRAPEAFLEALALGPRPLSEYALVRSGVRTGADGFFHLRPLSQALPCPFCGEPHGGDLVPVENGLGWRGYLEREALVPVALGPGDLGSPAPPLLWAPKRLLPHSARYARLGEEMGIPAKRSGSPWWRTELPPPPPILLPRGVYRSYAVYENPRGLQPGNRFFGVHLHPGVDRGELLSALRSPLFALSVELAAVPMGGGLT